MARLDYESFLSGLRLTTAKYFTPKGRSIHGKGIAPDIIVELPKVAAAAQPTETKPVATPSPEEELKKDAQVQRAVDILKAMRILDKSRPAPASPQARAK